MPEQEIIEGNKLIAEFDVPNWELLKSPDYNGELEPINLYTAALLCSKEYNLLKYDTSWNLLMPIIKKIVNGRKEYMFSCAEYITVAAMPINTDIEDAFEKVVEFIKWYNLCQSTK